jgi:hypothetical protein
MNIKFTNRLNSKKKKIFINLLDFNHFNIELYIDVYKHSSGFGGLKVTCWPLVPKFAGLHPAEAVGFLGRKNPQHAFLRWESKAIGPMSWLYGM